MRRPQAGSGAEGGAAGRGARADRPLGRAGTFLLRRLDEEETYTPREPGRTAFKTVSVTVYEPQADLPQRRLLLGHRTLPVTGGLVPPLTIVTRPRRRRKTRPARGSRELASFQQGWAVVRVVRPPTRP